MIAIQSSLSTSNVANYDWLEFDQTTMVGTFINSPERIMIPENIKESLIVELYSK